MTKKKRKKRLLRPCGVSLFGCEDLPQCGDVSLQKSLLAFSFFSFFDDDEATFQRPEQLKKRKIRLFPFGIFDISRLAEQTTLQYSPTPERAGAWQRKEKYTHQNPNICAPSVLRAETCKSRVAGGKKNSEREELLFYLWGTQRRHSFSPSHIWI